MGKAIVWAVVVDGTRVRIWREPTSLTTQNQWDIVVRAPQHHLRAALSALEGANGSAALRQAALAYRAKAVQRDRLDLARQIAAQLQAALELACFQYLALFVSTEMRPHLPAAFSAELTQTIILEHAAQIAYMSETALHETVKERVSAWKLAFGSDPAKN